MIQEARVRRAPMTGLGGHQRKHTAVVYLNEEWRGETVIVMRYSHYQKIMHDAKNKKLLLEIVMLKNRLARIKKMAS